MDNITMVEPFIDFGGKAVLVTGASSGIGRAIGVELSRRGAVPILIGRNPEKLAETAALLSGPNYHILVQDLTQSSQLEAGIRKLTEQTEMIYGLCHSAGIVETRPLRRLQSKALKQILDVNVVAGFELARSVCRRDIMEPGGGSILFVSSIYALVGVPGEIAYSSSKGAVTSGARAMAMELARRNIRVNTISPGLVKTGMTGKAFSILSKEQAQRIEDSHPLGPGTPEDVAKAAVFLLAPQTSWITGIDLVVDGGYTAQ